MTELKIEKATLFKLIYQIVESSTEELMAEPVTFKVKPPPEVVAKVKKLMEVIRN